MADEVGALAVEGLEDYTAPLYEWKEDMEGPGGAEMVGILDLDDHFTSDNVEGALDELATENDNQDNQINVLVDQTTDLTNAVDTHETRLNNHDTSIALKANINSPLFTGDPRAPTPALSDNDTSLATTAWVKGQGYSTGSGTGTVTSVNVNNGTGISFTGGPITTSGALTPALSANLQAWHLLAPSSKADTSALAAKADDSLVVHKAGAETVTGVKTFTGGSIRVQDFGLAGNGIVYLGDAAADSYVYKAGNTMTVKAGTSVMDMVGSGSVWHSGNAPGAADANSGARLGPTAQIITDWNSATSNGWWMGVGAANAPAALSGQWGIGRVTVHNAAWITQEVWQFTLVSNEQVVWKRQMASGVWGAWSGRVIASSHFTSATSSAVLGTTTAGSVYLRPTNADSTVGETRVYSNGDVAINGSAGFNAKLTVNGPSGTQTSIGVWQAGYGIAQIGYLPSDSRVYFRNCYTDGLLANGYGFTINTVGDVAFDNMTSYGSRLGQHINLWGTSYGLGIQNSTMYFRAGGSAGFAWHMAGTHSATQNDPGTGGTLLADLSQYGTFTATNLSTKSANGGYFNGNGTGMQYNGHLYFAGGDQNQLWANAANWVRIPRTFVQSGDPGAAAGEGDLWAW